MFDRVLPRYQRLDSLYRRVLGAAEIEGVAAALWSPCAQAFGSSLEWLGLAVPAANEGAILHLAEVTGERSVHLHAEINPSPANLGILHERRSPFLASPRRLEDLGGELSARLSTPALGSVATVPLAGDGGAPFGGLLLGLNRAVEIGLGEQLALLRRLQVVLRRTMPRLFASATQSRHARIQSSFIHLLSQFGAYHDSKLVAERALDYFEHELGFRRALVAAIDDEAGKIFGLSERGFNKVIRQVAFSYQSDLDIFSIATRSRRPAFYDNDPEDRRVPEFLRQPGTDRFLTLPMHVEDEVVAVALCEFDRSYLAYHREHLHLYRQLCDLLGQSLYISSIYSKLRRTAETDPLTGCFNRRALNDFLDQEIPRVKRNRQPLCLMMIDICDFKRFNDIYSHVVGDRILKSVARMLMDYTRDSDRVIRYGGDEFVVLMPTTNEKEAGVVVRRIEQAVADHNEAAKGPQEIYMLSVGLRCAAESTVDTILEDADREMYLRKAAQNRTKLYNAFTSDNVDEIKKSDSFVAVLIQNLTQREPHFIDHARKVMLYTQAICQYLGVNEKEMERASLAALLHDIGKITLPIGLLMKIEPLNSDDWAQLRMHPSAGADFLAGHKYLDDLRDVIKSHHERWDGKVKGPHPGYPDGLAGEQIPLLARIIRIAETYDDLTSPRPYRLGVMSSLDAIELLRSEAGHIFDPSLVKLFIHYLEMIHEPLADFSRTGLAS